MRGSSADDDAERLYTYRLYSDWKGSPTAQKRALSASASSSPTTLPADSRIHEMV